MTSVEWLWRVNKQWLHHSVDYLVWSEKCGSPSGTFARNNNQHKRFSPRGREALSIIKHTQILLWRDYLFIRRKGRRMKKVTAQEDEEAHVVKEREKFVSRAFYGNQLSWKVYNLKELIPFGSTVNLFCLAFCFAHGAHIPPCAGLHEGNRYGGHRNNQKARSSLTGRLPRITIRLCTKLSKACNMQRVWPVKVATNPKRQQQQQQYLRFFKKKYG